MRILIAEDTRANLFLFKAYLKGAGVELEEAHDGQDAVEKTLGGCFDLILMDLQMPIMDGFEATRCIRKWERENGRVPIPILALTAHEEAEYADQTFAAGCTAHLTKPISTVVLLEAIAKYSGSGPVAAIRVQGDLDLRDLIPSFLDSRRRDLNTMLAALEDANLDVIRELGHNMKGSGGGYGLPEISRIGALLESSVKVRDSNDIRKQLDTLSDYLTRVEVVYSDDTGISGT
jgi:CheY-like chemotaxis protein